MYYDEGMPVSHILLFMRSLKCIVDKKPNLVKKKPKFVIVVAAIIILSAIFGRDILKLSGM